MKKTLLLFVIILFFLTFKTSAQSGFNQLVKGGPADATVLIDAYSEPLFKGFGNTLNGGWANTAKTKKFLHVDFRISASIAIVPTIDKTFNVDGIGLSTAIRPDNATLYTGSTIAGERGAPGPVLDIYDSNSKKIGSFVLPSGQTPVIPAPIIEATVGLIRNTDLIIRGIPSVQLPEGVGSTSMIGAALKHNIMQDFAGSSEKDVPPFDLSILIGYTRLNYNRSLTVNPDPGAQPNNSGQSTDFSNQHIQTNFDNYTAQAIFSKKLGRVTPFISFGYQVTNTALELVGNYPLTTNQTGTQQYFETFNNPVYIDETSTSGLRADIGFQVEIGFFRIYGSFGEAQYKTVNAGIGFGL